MKGWGKLWGDEAQIGKAELLSTGVRIQGTIQVPWSEFEPGPMQVTYKALTH